MSRTTVKETQLVLALEALFSLLSLYYCTCQDDDVLSPTDDTHQMIEDENFHFLPKVKLP